MQERQQKCPEASWTAIDMYACDCPLFCQLAGAVCEDLHQQYGTCEMCKPVLECPARRALQPFHWLGQPRFLP